MNALAGILESPPQPLPLFVIILLNAAWCTAMFVLLHPLIRTFVVRPAMWAGRLRSWGLEHRVAVAWRVALVVGLVPAVIEGLLPHGSPARGAILFAILFFVVFSLLAARPVIPQPEN